METPMTKFIIETKDLGYEISYSVTRYDDNSTVPCEGYAPKSLEDCFQVIRESEQEKLVAGWDRLTQNQKFYRELAEKLFPFLKPLFDDRFTLVINKTKPATKEAIEKLARELMPFIDKSKNDGN
jgi:enterochelin esterase-like enzyme